MNFGEHVRNQLQILKHLAFGLSMAMVPQAAMAQEEPAADAAATASAYQPLGPDMIKGAPTPGGLGLQEQYSPIGKQAIEMHNGLLLPVITIISLVVLFLLLWVMARYNRRANPNPSRTSHNTLLEVIWTGVPILILVGIAIPSVNLLRAQYASPPEDAVTLKVTGYQWYWGYSYPDNGGFEVIANMMPEEEAEEKGLPGHLETDNRIVVPVGKPIRVQVTAADVIHSWAVPSLWFKLDAVPGQINEKTMQIDEVGIYYGQCSELCGARHGYMPIAIEAVPQEQFDAWVALQGGTVAGAAEAEEAAAPAEETAASEV